MYTYIYMYMHMCIHIYIYACIAIHICMIVDCFIDSLKFSIFANNTQ